MGQPVYLPRLYVGSEALVGVGAHARLGEHLRVVGEATLLVPLDHAGAALCPEAARCKDGDLTGEALVGVGFGAGQLSFTLAGGTGIVPDAARGPAFRVIGALAWTPLPRSVTARVDDDGDRIPGGVDICPDEPEDGDGFQDDDGCPDLDNDLDGVLDATDRCADEPEDRDAFQDEDGCAEGDNDGDGVADSTDLCPTIGEDRDGHADDDGCPDEDNDGDGVLDARDKCRDEAETVNGYDDLDGCPDQAVQGGPRLGATAIDLQGERIEFVGATDQLTRASKATLDGVAEVMRKNPRVRFRVEVGVEQTGKKRRDLDADQRLTERRAEAVRAYLQAQGVPVAQLDIAGLGSTRPIDADPRSVKNRRVEFIRLNQ
jgi:outer membrane protein OmpA-like peptidoglycan-associated protein